MPAGRCWQVHAIIKFNWKEGEVFSAQVWMLNDLPETLEAGVFIVTLVAGDVRNANCVMGIWTGQPKYQSEGPVVKGILPHWKTDRFTLELEVEGHPEYNSTYTFLYSTE